MNSHKPLTAGEIEEIKSLEAKATPGPWAWEFTGDDNTCAVGTVMDENDNFVAGMVDGDADTIVVDSVCREVTNQQDAAFIAAARNALPRLLSLLTPPPDAAVREAVEFSAEVRCNRLARGILRIGKKLRVMRADMASQTDALIAAMHAINDAGLLMPDEVLDYISGVRAVQAPRLTREQVRAALSLLSEMDKMLGEDIQPEDDRPAALAMQRFCAAFPEAFAGEVGRGE